MDAKVTWMNGLAFSAAADTGNTLDLDADTAAGGMGGGFKPMEMFAIGLAGCTAMDVISILSKKRQEVTAFEVQTHLERASEHPKVFTRGVLHYEVTGRGVDPAAVLRAIELSTTRYCPAQAMLGRLFPITQTYTIYELGEDGARREAFHGEASFTPGPAA
jgi:putative redox protein